MNLLEEIIFLLEETAIVWLVNIAILFWLIKLKRNYISVIGTCVEREYELRTEALTFIYEYEGKNYKSRTSIVNLPFKVKVNKQYKIYVLKWNPRKLIIHRDVKLMVIFVIMNFIGIIIISYAHFCFR